VLLRRLRHGAFYSPVFCAENSALLIYFVTAHLFDLLCQCPLLQFQPSPDTMFCRWLYVASASSLTPTSACRNMFSRPSLAALQSCVNCAVSSDSYRCCTCSVAAGSGNATLAGLPTRLLHRLHPFSSPQLGRSPVFVARNTSLMLLPLFTGYGHPSTSSLNWRSSSTEPSTALLLGICLIGSATSLICLREVDFARQLPDFSTSALSRLVTVGDRWFLLLDHGFGTAYLKTFSLLCHWQHLGEN